MKDKQNTLLQYRNRFSKKRITNNDDFGFKSPIRKPEHFMLVFTILNQSGLVFNIKLVIPMPSINFIHPKRSLDCLIIFQLTNLLFALWHFPRKERKTCHCCQ